MFLLPVFLLFPQSYGRHERPCSWWRWFCLERRRFVLLIVVMSPKTLAKALFLLVLGRFGIIKPKLLKIFFLG